MYYTFNVKPESSVTDYQILNFSHFLYYCTLFVGGRGGGCTIVHCIQYCLWCFAINLFELYSKNNSIRNLSAECYFTCFFYYCRSHKT